MTDLGLPGFGDEGPIRPRAVHPGVTVGDVAAAGGRPLRLHPRVETLAPPPPAGRAVAAALRAAGASRERDREGGRT